MACVIYIWLLPCGVLLAVSHQREQKAILMYLLDMRVSFSELLDWVLLIIATCRNRDHVTPIRHYFMK